MDNDEALRRIRKAEATGTTSLDLSGIQSLRQLPQELKRLTALQELNLSFCRQLRDLRPLAGLTGLQRLNLARCSVNERLALPVGMDSLQRLDLCDYWSLRELALPAGLGLLPMLNLSQCSQLRELALPTACSRELSWNVRYHRTDRMMMS